ATIRLRYKLMPAIYTAYDQHTRTGAPVIKPVFWNSLTDSVAMSIDDEFILGDHLLVAPVVEPGKNTRDVYLPAGRWYRVGSNEAYSGSQRITANAPNVESDGGDTTGLAGLPVFARAGAVIPSAPVVDFEGQRKIDTLRLDVYPGSATSEVYEDAGDGYAYQRGEFRRTTFTTSAQSLAMSRTGSYAGVTSFIVVFHDVARPRRVLVDGRAARFDYNDASHEVRIAIPSTARTVRLE
ncbi:MAG TPA: DUF5110 domain-containing protein, partial [Gemmatimonadaceae bacterium]|nr:DUF5110 domain-containing protein [Gemmatimonadaceae bacterium]